MNEFDNPGFAEYVYRKKAEGKLRLKKTLLLIGYFAFILVYFLVCYISRVIPLFAVAPLFLWMLVYFTWHRVNPECYAELTAGKLTMGYTKRAKNGRTREAVLVITLQEARYVMPATEYDPGKKRVIDLSSSTLSPRRVAIETADGETVVYFDSTYKINALLAHYPAASRSLKEMAIS